MSSNTMFERLDPATQKLRLAQSPKRDENICQDCGVTFPVRPANAHKQPRCKDCAKVHKKALQRKNWHAFNARRNQYLQLEAATQSMDEINDMQATPRPMGYAISGGVW